MAHLRAVQQQQQQQISSTQAIARIKELEEEIGRLTMENAKVKAELEKAQRRWERLKEGARRRRREGTTYATTNDNDGAGDAGVGNEETRIPEGDEKE
jgi:TolA-binding protein